MTYTDNKGRTLDVTVVWDGSDVTEDVLGAPRTGADLDLRWSRRRKTTPTAAAAFLTSCRPR